MRYLVPLMLVLGLPVACSVAHASDIRVSWDAVSQYEPGSSTNGVKDVADLPAGVVSYELWKSVNGATYLKQVEGTANSYLVRNQAPGHYCFKALAKFAPTVATADTWSPSVFSDEACIDVKDTGGVGPRNLVPLAPKSLNVRIPVSSP